MELKDQVCSLELAKKLKELGVKQESLQYWFFDSYGGGELRKADPDQIIWKDKWMVIALGPKAEFRDLPPLISAFTVAELGEMLLRKIGDAYWVSGPDAESGFAIMYTDGERLVGEEFHEDTEADARAKMLIYLIEEKLLIPKVEARP